MRTSATARQILSKLVRTAAVCRCTPRLSFLVALHLQEGKAFLAANKDKEGVIETPSGLQYKVLKSGKDGGKTPLVSTKCLCHYRGELLGGLPSVWVLRGSPQLRGSVGSEVVCV